MKRRAVLASLGAALSGLAGCAALPGDGAPRRTLTPAPVPTDTGTPRAHVTETEAPGCPELPAAAERYVCSPEAAAGLALRPTTDAGAGGPAGRAFTLTNGTDRVFETGRDRWLLARRADGGWQTVDTGGSSADLALPTGGTFTWVLAGTDGQRSEESRGSSGLRARVPTRLGVGGHAFVVTGHAGDELVAVVAPFWVPRPGVGTASRTEERG
ncbi:hypothetical protein [Salinirussus salinus]|uniref:hypothetical protein n=1 Tax=Salinirussus salinus TaxID=1198300 RepID=UPI001358CB8B|nr:hypothetical protein [Salinirussus salinus]